MHHLCCASIVRAMCVSYVELNDISFDSILQYRKFSCSRYGYLLFDNFTDIRFDSLLQATLEESPRPTQHESSHTERVMFHFHVHQWPYDDGIDDRATMARESYT